MFCEKCGKQLLENEKFCEKCGAKTNVPNANVPNVNVPNVNVPNANVPNANVPNANVPNANVPNVNVPNVNVPNANVPNANVPNANVPNANVPNGYQPNANVPNANVPNGYQPNANVPNGYQPNGTATAQPKKASFLSKIPKPALFGGIGAIVVAIVVIIIFATAKPTINLNDYMSIRVEGVNGHGTAVTLLNLRNMEKDFGDKIKYTNEAIELDPYNIIISDTPIETLNTFTSITLDKYNNLSNGDKIKYSWDVAKDIGELINCNVEYTDGEYEVSGLTEAEGFDAFEGVKVEFEGISPRGEAILSYDTVEGLYYTLDKDSLLANDEVITLEVKFNTSLEDYISEYGKIPNEMEKEITVSGLDEFVATYEELPTDYVENRRTAIQSAVAEEYKENLDKEVQFKGLEYAGYAFVVRAVGSRDDESIDKNYNTNFNVPANEVWYIFKAEISNAKGEFPKQTLYIPVVDADVCKYADSEEIEVLGYTAYANKMKINDKYEVLGYTDPADIYTDIKGKYDERYDYYSVGDGFEKLENQE